MKDLTTIERINLKFKTMTKTEKKLAQFVLEHKDTILKLSVSAFAVQSGVSEATIVRFSKTLGYKGFLDMKINLAKEVSPKSLEVSPIIEQGDSYESIFEKIFTANMAVLKSTFANLNKSNLPGIVNHFVAARNIYLFGTGGSQKVVSDVSHKFLKVGIPTISYEDIDLQLMSSVLATKDDAVIAVSFSGANYNTIKCVENVKRNGAYVLSITSNDNSPLQKISDDTLFSASDETVFQSESISTRIAQLSLLDGIVTCVATNQEHYSDAKEAIMKTREATSYNKY
ncbi:MurR/RpiR family transcriptional regulator [Peptoniphilaceae bacterium SGI.137]